MVNDALSQLEDLFAGMYEDASKGGRPSIAPQKLLRFVDGTATSCSQPEAVGQGEAHDKRAWICPRIRLCS